MKHNLLFTVLACLLINEPSAVADNAEDSQTEINQKQRQIQIMNDRLVNKLPQFSLSGPLAVSGTNKFSVNGEGFQIKPETQIQGELRRGAMAEVRGFISPGQPKIAEQIVIFDSQEQSRVSEQDEGSVGKPLLAR